MANGLAEAACKNNEQALIHLMTVYGTEIKRLCLCILNDPYLAEDAAQETFFRAWKGFSGFRNDCSEKTWLCRIAVNTCWSMMRKIWFRSVTKQIAINDISNQTEKQLDYDPTVWNAVQSLPEKLRLATVLRYYEELSLEETAIALGTNINTLNTRLRKARSILQKKLKGWYFDEDEYNQKCDD